MISSVYIDKETAKWIEHLNLIPSEILREGVEREKELHIKFMLKEGKEVLIE